MFEERPPDLRFPRIEQALESLNDVVLICEAKPVDLPGPRIVYVNGAFERMSGYASHEVIGRTPRILQGPRTSRSELDRLRAALASWNSCRVLVTNYRKDRTPFDVEFDVVPVANEAGWFTHWLSVQRDMTRSLCAQKEIELAESIEGLATGVLRELVEYANGDAACWERWDAPMNRWNVLCGVVRDRGTGTYTFDAIAFDADGRRAVFTHTVDALVAPPGAVKARIAVWRSEEPLPDYAAPLVAAVAARAAATFGRLLANEARDEMESRLRQAQKLESIGRLAGGIAHDFNNLLTIIVGNLELLKERMIPSTNPMFRADGFDELAELAKASDRARILVQHLLTFSRQESLSLHSIDLRIVIQSTVALLRRTLGSRILIAVDASDTMPRVRGDAALLEQVLINLAINARDAMQSANGMPTLPASGCISIRVTAVQLTAGGAAGWERLSDGAYLCLSFEDDGPGMPPHVLSRAFDPFFTTKEVGAGTGLGLSSVYGAVTQMGGAIRLDHVVPHGVRARIMLPVDDTTAGATTPINAVPR